jgi:hypothetical protein
MFDTTPAVSRHSAGTRSRARSTRFSRVANLARSPRRTSLTETLSVGLGLTQR